MPPSNAHPHEIKANELIAVTNVSNNNHDGCGQLDTGHPPPPEQLIYNVSPGQYLDLQITHRITTCYNGGGSVMMMGDGCWARLSSVVRCQSSGYCVSCELSWFIVHQIVKAPSRDAMGRIKLLKDSSIRFPGTATPVTTQLG